MFQNICLLRMRFTHVRLRMSWKKGHWARIKGAQDSGKTFLPPIVSEGQRKEMIDGLWREAKNEMWLVRHKYEVSLLFLDLLSKDKFRNLQKK